MPAVEQAISTSFKTVVSSLSIVCGACTVGPGNFGSGVPAEDSGGAEDTIGEASTTDASDASSSNADESSGTTHDPLYDVGGRPGDPPGDICKVGRGFDAPMPCEHKAPPDSFEPELQWSWNGDDVNHDSASTPLVANLTDDNDDGVIDLCDTPDVLVVANPATNQTGAIYVLDGATGALHFSISSPPFSRASTPAIGDIDADGVPEIVALAGNYMGTRVMAFENDGTPKWTTNAPVQYWEHAVALADLDADGDVEIMAGRQVIDHDGNLVVELPGDPNLAFFSTTTAADLDEDGDMEVILGAAAYHHDGSEYYNQPGEFPSHPHIADFDGDDRAEILLVSQGGLSMLETDGTVVYSHLEPTGDPDWRRPAVVHDMNGDGDVEFAVSSSSTFAVYEPDASIVWQAVVQDDSGTASGTAFDFLGDGTAEAIYADESKMFVFGETGNVLMSTPRSSGTIIEYPTVADVDNDGSAEIVVVSNAYAPPKSPTVQVFRDVEDRWIQPRRIWNQHTYHVTNVREDGTIPQVEPMHWKTLNTFRSNAQIEGGAVCAPEG